MRRAEKMKVAMWISKISNISDLEVKFQYAKLLATILEAGVLLGPFVEEPPEDLQPLPEEYSAPNAVQVLREQKVRQGGSGDRPPVITEVSSNLTEYVAAQLIPKFGVHCYYAVSDEPLTEWRQAGDAARTASSASPSRPRPKTECNIGEAQREDCTLCALMDDLDEDRGGCQWIEYRPSSHGRQEEIDWPTSPCGQSTPTRAPRRPPPSPAGALRSVRAGTPTSERILLPQELILPSVSALASLSSLGIHTLLPTTQGSTQPSSTPITPGADLASRGLLRPPASPLSSIGPLGASLISMTPPTSLTSGSFVPCGLTSASPLASARPPVSRVLSRTREAAGTATSTEIKRPPPTPGSPLAYAQRVPIKTEPVSRVPSEYDFSSAPEAAAYAAIKRPPPSPAPPLAYSPRVPMEAEPVSRLPSGHDFLHDYEVKEEPEYFQKSASGQDLSSIPSLRGLKACDSPNCPSPSQPQATASVSPRQSPYTSHGRAQGVDSRNVGEESLFADLFGDEQPKQNIMSIVQRLKQQQVEGRELSKTYLAEIEASTRRREQIQAMRSRTPRTQAYPVPPMSAPQVGHVPQSRYSQDPGDIVRRMQQQNEESRDGSRRQMGREQKHRNKELMRQQNAGGTPRSGRGFSGDMSRVRFKQEEPSETSEMVEECMDECFEQPECPEAYDSPCDADSDCAPAPAPRPWPMWSSARDDRRSPFKGPSGRRGAL